MENSSPPPSCPSNANNPPSNPHLARLYYNQQPNMGCTSPSHMQSGGYFFQGPSPQGAPITQQPQIVYAYPHPFMQPVQQCDHCSMNMLHAQMHGHYLQQPVQYVAPRNLPTYQNLLVTQPPQGPVGSSSSHGSGGQTSPYPGSTSPHNAQVLWRPSGPPSFSGSDKLSDHEEHGPFMPRQPSADDSSYETPLVPVQIPPTDPKVVNPKVAEIGDDHDHEEDGRYYTGAKLEKEKGRTPLFGQHPAWWGGEGAKKDDVQTSPPTTGRHSRGPSRGSSPRTDDPSPAVSHGSPKTHPSPPSRPRHEAYTLQLSPDHPSPPIQSGTEEPVRPRRSDAFDIPISPRGKEERKAIERRRTEAFDIPFRDDVEVKLRDGKPRAETTPLNGKDRDTRASLAVHQESTAFTITFDTDDKPKNKESMEDRLSKHNEVKERLAQKHMARRSMKKYGGTMSDHSFDRKQPEKSKTQPSRDSYPAAATDGKRFLLDKMLSAGNSDDLPSPLDDAEIRSEAGTYVLDEEDESETEARSEIEKVFAVTGRLDLVFDDEGSKTPSPDLDPQEPIIKPTMTRDRTSNVYQKRSHSSHRVSAQSDAVIEGRVAQQRPTPIKGRPIPARPGGPPRLSKPAPAAPELIGQGRRTQSFVRANQTRRSVVPVSSEKSPALSRGDGGRFSMRGGANQAIARKGKSPQVQKPEKIEANPEMNAWLRRKKYNPMKAVADEKQRKKVQAVQPPLLSTRSRSFHSGLTVKTTSLSAVKTEVVEHMEKVDEIPTSAASSVPPLGDPSADEEFVETVDQLSRELSSVAEETLNRLRSLDPSFTGSEMDLTDLTATDRILAQLIAAKQAFSVVNEHLVQQSSREASRAENLSGSEESGVLTAKTKKLLISDDSFDSLSVTIPYYSAECDLLKSTGEPAFDVPASSSACTSDGQTNQTNSLEETGADTGLTSAPRTEQPHSDFGNSEDHIGDTEATSSRTFHLQETLNCLKPYWEKRSKQ